MTQGHVYVTGSSPLKENVWKLLDRCRLAKRIENAERIVIKPNLVDILEPPITTPVAVVSAVVGYLQAHCRNVSLLVGEGTASASHTTMDVFAALGYDRLVRENNVELIDLNHEQTRLLTHPDCGRWPEMYLPAVCLDSFLISIPVLKAHSLAGVTLSLKNMMGLAPPRHYQKGTGWKKSAFHDRIQEAIADLNRYRHADFTLLDASAGLAEFHLGGPLCQPPPKRLIAGYDPVAVDSYGAFLLQRDWRQIGHIRMLDNDIGQADPLLVEEI